VAPTGVSVGSRGLTGERARVPHHANSSSNALASFRSTFHCRYSYYDNRLVVMIAPEPGHDVRTVESDPVIFFWVHRPLTS
jgi:hypothetical protein